MEEEEEATNGRETDEDEMEGEEQAVIEPDLEGFVLDIDDSDQVEEDGQPADDDPLGPSRAKVTPSKNIPCSFEACNVFFSSVKALQRHIHNMHKRKPNKSRRTNFLHEEVNTRSQNKKVEKWPVIEIESSEEDDEEEEGETPPLCIICCYSFSPPCGEGDKKEGEEEDLLKSPQFKKFVSELVQDKTGFQPGMLKSSILKRLSFCADCKHLTKLAMEKQLPKTEEENRVKRLHKKIIRKLGKLQNGMIEYGVEMRTLEDVVSKSNVFCLEEDMDRKRQFAQHSRVIAVEQNMVMMFRNGIISTANELEKANSGLVQVLVSSDSESQGTSSESDFDEDTEGNKSEENNGPFNEDGSINTTGWTPLKKKLLKACGTGIPFPRLEYNPKTGIFSIGPVTLIVDEENETLECSECNSKATETSCEKSTSKTWQEMQKHVHRNHLYIEENMKQMTMRKRKRRSSDYDSSSSEEETNAKRGRNLRKRRDAPKYVVDDDNSDEDADESESEPDDKQKSDNEVSRDESSKEEINQSNEEEVEKKS